MIKTHSFSGAGVAQLNQYQTDIEDKVKAGNVFFVPNLPQNDLVLAAWAVCGVITAFLPSPSLLDQAFF